LKKYLYILFIVNTSFLYGAYNSNVQENPYEEKFEIISTSPFYEGQILSQSDETPKQNEVDYEELKLISMREFDIASDEEEKKEQKRAKNKSLSTCKNYDTRRTSSTYKSYGTRRIYSKNRRTC
jgi:hypothetical protein